MSVRKTESAYKCFSEREFLPFLKSAKGRNRVGMFYKIAPPPNSSFHQLGIILDVCPCRKECCRDVSELIFIWHPLCLGSDPLKSCMKNRLGLILSLCFFALCSIANAIPIYQLPGTKDSVTGLSGDVPSDIPKNGTGGGGGNANANNDASN